MLVLLLATQRLAWSQDVAAPGPLSVISAAESEALARRVAAPVPAVSSQAELRRLYIDKAEAARRLADVAALERVLREAVDAMPQEDRWPNDLGLLLRDAARHEEALRWFDIAIARATREPLRIFYQSNRLSVPVRRSPEDLAREAAELRQRAQYALRDRPSALERLSLLRAIASTHAREAEGSLRRGLSNDELAARSAALQAHREAFDAAQALPPAAAWLVPLTAHGLAVAQRDLANALLRLGRHAQAETTIDAHMRFVREQGLSATMTAFAHHLMALMRMRRGEFDDAERQLRLSAQVLDGLRYPRSHPFQTTRSRDLMMVLWAAGRTGAALREMELLDEALKRDGVSTAVRGRFPFERGLVLLAAGRHAEAAHEFAALERFTRSELGGGHFYSAQAQALQGTALWLGADPAQRDAAARLLEAGVPGMLAPDNADFMDDANARRKVRTLIFNAHLEAMAWRGGDKAATALGVADRRLAGATGQAMTDAALRSAAAQPELADLVRREQDARLLVQALGDDLREGDGSEDKRRAADETQALRQRLGEAETLLQAKRDELRRRYPEFDRLLRPALATPAEVQRSLAKDEVLLLALPAERALFLWAVVADAPVRFVRVEVTRDALQEQVQRLRSGLDFGLSGGRTPRFDRGLAQALHGTLLAPVAAALQGRRQLIVATTGPLAGLPFAALLQPTQDGSDQWVARQWAPSQVPSVAAWLALRQLPPARPAAEPLLAWADPAYAPATGGTGTASPASASSASSAVSTASAASAARAGPPRLQLTRQAAATAADAMTLRSLPPLPETRDEARAIALALKANPERDLVMGTRATRESVLAASRSGELARKRVVIFATHGLVAGDLPGLAQPALALAPASGSDDLLASLIGLDDILGLKLNADWVVLSACNTGGTDGRAEEALSGLARGFLYAGSRSLLVTHWAVETESAKLLTTATFEHHATHPQASKAESLRQAMLRVMSDPKYSQPAFWAPFALVGDGAR